MNKEKNLKGGYRMNKSKVEDLAVSISDLLKKEQVKEEKKCHPVVCILAIVGGIVAVAAIAYAVYRYFTPDYLEDFEDDFDDDFDDDFFEDETDDDDEGIPVAKADSKKDSSSEE